MFTPCLLVYCQLTSRCFLDLPVFKGGSQHRNVVVRASIESHLVTVTTHVFMCVHVCVCVHMHAHVCMCVCVGMCVWVCACACVCLYVC